MTMPNERTHTILQTKLFLEELLDSHATPGVPEQVRHQARVLLRHFPSDWQLRAISSEAPDWFGPPNANS
jgi:hypothetical protein